MDADKIEQAFRSAGIDKSITCPEAFSIAAKFHIPKKDISEYCNTHNVKIRGCQLGCFK